MSLNYDNALVLRLFSRLSFELNKQYGPVTRYRGLVTPPWNDTFLIQLVQKRTKWTKLDELSLAIFGEPDYYKNKLQ